MKKILIVLALTLVAISCNRTISPSPATEEPKAILSLKTYTNTKRGFTMQYPATWSVREVDTTSHHNIIITEGSTEKFRIVTSELKLLPKSNQIDSITIDGTTYPMYVGDIGFYYIDFQRGDISYSIFGDLQGKKSIDPVQKQTISSIDFK